MSKAGAAVYLTAAQYLIAEQVAAAAWDDPRYSWAHNYISDLGIPDCTVDICSPHHVVMNTSFVALGVTIASGSILMRRHLRPGPLRRLALTLMIASGVGDVLVGLFPGSVEGSGGSDLMHTIGAGLAIVGGNAGILVTGLLLRRGSHRVLGAYSVTSGVVGLAAFTLFALGIDAGLGIGTVERLAVDPIVVWMIAVGALGTARALRRQNRASRSRSSSDCLRSTPPA